MTRLTLPTTLIIMALTSGVAWAQSSHNSPAAAPPIAQDSGDDVDNGEERGDDVDNGEESGDDVDDGGESGDAPAFAESAEGGDAEGADAEGGDEAQAQGEEAVAEEPPEPRPRYGGFGFFQPAIMGGNVTGLESLTEFNSLGDGARIDAQKYQLGGGAYAFYEGFMLGGRGFDLLFEDIGGTNGAATLSGGGGGLMFGYGFFSGNRLFYPSVGIGGGSMKVDIVNDTDRQLAFGGARVAPGQKASFDAGFVYTEINVGMVWFLPSEYGGVALGLEAGAMINNTGDNWNDASGADIGAGRPDFSLLHLRLTVGGGGFFTE